MRGSPYQFTGKSAISSSCRANIQWRTPQRFERALFGKASGAAATNELGERTEAAVPRAAAASSSSSAASASSVFMVAAVVVIVTRPLVRGPFALFFLSLPSFLSERNLRVGGSLKRPPARPSLLRNADLPRRSEVPRHSPTPPPSPSLPYLTFNAISFSGPSPRVL